MRAFQGRKGQMSFLRRTVFGRGLFFFSAEIQSCVSVKLGCYTHIMIHYDDNEHLGTLVLWNELRIDAEIAKGR
jgi:hypothetical protein